MNIILYRGFHKKENSTKRPANDYTPKYTVEGYLRDDCNIVTPVVQFKRFPSDIAPGSITYALIAEFNRFYYVRDWTWINGLWEAHMVVDVLATFKSQIGSLSAYIERTSASQYVNGAIIDKQYPSTTNFNFERIEFTPDWYDVSTGNGCFVVGVTGQDFTLSGTGVVYYILTLAQMRRLINYLMSNDFYNDIGFTNLTSQPITPEVAKAIYNPIQYITSCFWFPQSISNLNLGSPKQIGIGPYSSSVLPSDVKGYLLGSGFPYYSENITVSLTASATHPQAPTRGKYLNYNPHTTMTLFIPPFGTVPLDPSYFEVGDDLRIYVYVDMVTGKGRMILGSITSGAGTPPRYFAEYNTLFGVPVQIAQASTDYIDYAVSLMDTAEKSVLQPFNMSGAMESFGNALESLMPRVISKGINGSKVAFEGGKPHVLIRHTIMADDDNMDYGRPCGQTLQISTVGDFDGGGQYIKCANVHIDVNCLEEEVPMIKQQLLDGFYYE